MRLRTLATTTVLALAAAGASMAAELRWSDLPALPGLEGQSGLLVAVLDGRLVVAGGSNGGGPGEGGSDAAFVLDAADSDWRVAAGLPPRVAFGTAAAMGAVAVLVPGVAGSGADSGNGAFLVRSEDGTFGYEPLPDLPVQCTEPHAAAVDGEIFVACTVTQGSAPAGAALSVLRLGLDPRGSAWEQIDLDSRVVEGPAGVAAVDGTLYLFESTVADLGVTGGGTGVPGPYLYRPESGWSDRKAGPSPGRVIGASPLGPTHVAVVAEDSGFATADAYHTVTDTWVRLGSLSPDLAARAMTVWNDDLVVLASGPDGAPRLLLGRLESQETGFSEVDYITLAAYLAALVMMGVYFARKSSSTEDFFLAGRRMPWWATGLSIFGTQLSSISFMAVPAKVYSTDWVYFLLQMSIVLVAFPVVFFYLPHFRRTRMTSAYEYLETRFNLPVRLYASVSFVLYQLGRMAIVLFLPAIALSTVTGISVYSCILAMGILSTVYTVMGGIRAVIWTDVVQVFVLYGGALLSLAILLTTLDGGLGGLIESGLQYDKFHVFNWTWDWTTTAVWVVLVGNLFMNLVPYTSDQAVVQRYLVTKDERAAARSIWTNAVLLIPSTLTLFLLGTGLWAFYRIHPHLLHPTLPTDSIFPLFIAQQLPTGIAGLLIAGVFAASMSTLDSSLNSVSAALVTDFYVRFRPRSSDRSRLRLARLLTAGLGALATATSIALATFDIGSLWDTFQGMMGLLGGGLAGLFALGVFFPSTTGRGAMTGAVASVIVLYSVQQHTDLHFFLYGLVGVSSCVGIGLVASRLWRPSPA